MYFNWISTASFIALNNRGPKTCFNCIIGSTKLIQLFCVHSEKIKVVSIEHLKQKLSLENN